MHLDEPILPSARPRILVAGDLMLDLFEVCDSHRISPEAPVPVLEPRERILRPGGAANVAANLAALGCAVSVAGLVGEDAEGDQLLAALAEVGVNCAAILRDPHRPTTSKRRFVVGHRQVARVDAESRQPLDPSLADRAAQLCVEQIGEVDGVICSDYRKGFLTEPLLRRLIDSAAARGLPVVVDPKGVDYGRYRGATALTPNLHELGLATGAVIEGATARDGAAARVLAQTGARLLLVTCGADGMILYQDGRPTLVEAAARTVFDVTGAGDTAAAVFGLGLCAGLSAAAAARLANTAAGVVVGKPGTAVVTELELAAALGTAHRGAKVLSRAAAGRRAADLRAAGQRLVFTNGCFDLLHAGHLALLEAARTLGDCLWVGLNSDLSVRRLKGERRPLVGEEDRARLLGGLGCVDAVILFDEDTPAALIDEILPAVLVKGGDYQPDEVVGAEAVKAAGGRVEIVPLWGSHSTTRLIETIVAAYRAR